MNNRPLISVVTSVRNGAATITRTIESVISQDYSPIEFIIVDAVSDDGTSEIIQRYRDRIDVSIREPDEGPVHGVNKGIARSTGDIFFLLGADDQLEPHAVSRAVERFNQDPEIQVVHGNFRYHYASTGETLVCRPRLDFTDHPFRWPQVFVNTFFMKRALVDIYGLRNSNYPHAEDFELYLRYLTHGVRFGYLDANLVYAESGGASYLSIDGYRELREIARSYGQSTVRAYYDYALKVVERMTARSLENTKVGSLLKKRYGRLRFPNISFEK